LLCLDAEPFDLLLSDGRLPDGNGCEVMASARERHGIRGLVVSGHGDHDDLARYSAAGFDHVLIKPANFDRILRAMNRVSTLPPLLSPPGTQWPTFPATPRTATGRS
jgi:DNA-binding response OmpR family regulator